MSEANFSLNEKDKEKNDAKILILSRINSNCRTIANNFFDCMEKKYREIDKRYPRSIEEIEKISNDEFVPYCMNKFNLEECLEKNKPKPKVSK